MTRTRMIGLALVAAFALSAVASASASAFTLFVSSSLGQKAAALQKTKHIFTVEGKKVECELAHFTGTTLATSLLFTKFTTLAKYEKCTAFTFISSTVNMHTCKYELGIGGLVNIVGCAGSEIEINVNNGAGCKITVEEQKLKGITYANVTGKNGRASTEVKIAVKEIKSTSNGAGTGCPIKSKVKGETKGEYTGTAVAEGETGTLKVENS
jgi:hypothetical protein